MSSSFWIPTQNPSSTTRRIATLRLFPAPIEWELSEPIVHYKKDCDYFVSARIAIRSSNSEPIVHYKKDCDRSLCTAPAAIRASSEPIVHYKKDCDAFVLEIFRNDRIRFSEPIVHYKKDCDDERKSPTPTRWVLRTHRPLQEGLRLRRSREIVFVKAAQNPSSTTRRIATTSP